MHGSSLRLQRIFAVDGRAFILPIDEPVIGGPPPALKSRAKITGLLEQLGISATLGYANSLPADAGRLTRVGRIVHLSVSTALSNHTHKRPMGSVRQALAAGADAVAAQVHFTDEHETEMLRHLANTVAEAEQFGLPTLAIAYPRRRDSAGGDDNYASLADSSPTEYTELIVHGARACVDLGAAIVKVPFPGRPELLAGVVDACAPARVVVAGGPYVSDRHTVDLARAVTQSGAGGVSIGRGLLGCSDPLRVASEIRALLVGDSLER
jgi:DhnA family fructose-bisphosphate aldolase class Ia